MTSRFPTADELASWPTPNYVNPETRRPLALAVNIPMTVLVIAFISCRFYSRTVLTRSLGWDDWFMLAAAVSAVGNNIMVIVSMMPAYQMGYHLWDIPPLKLYGTLKSAQMGMATQLLYTVVVTLMKVAILLTYLRIFPSKRNKWFCYVMLFYTVSLNTACFFVTLFQCSPASTYWNIFKYFMTAKCLNIKAIYYFHSAQNTLSDFIIFLWPAKDLAKVQISFRQRVTLTSMFCLGIIVCIAGIVRLYYTHVYLHSYDVFWDGACTFVIMSVEAGVGVICGCLPGCKPLMSRMFPRVFGTVSNSNAQAYQKSSKSFGDSSQQSVNFVRRESNRSAAGSSNLQRQGSNLTRQGSTLTRQGSNLTQKRFMNDITDKPLPSIPEPMPQIPRRSRRMSFGRLRRNSRGFHDMERGSEEIFIMQEFPANRRNMEHFA